MVELTAVGRGVDASLLALILPDTTNPLFAQLGRSIQQAAEAAGLITILANHSSDPDLETRLVTDLAARGADRMIVASTGRARWLTDAAARSSAVVLVDAPGPVPGHASIGPAADQGTADAVRHLIDVHGHRAVALLLAEQGSAAQQRELGWAAGLAESGIPAGPVVRTPSSYDGGYVAGRQLLERADRPTAVIASCDIQAFGLLRAMWEAGLAVPGDLAVVSFDGTPGTSFARPPLTVVQQPVDAMATAAVAAVVAQGGPGEGHRSFAMDLVVRRSCGCPPPD